jgi:plasmid stabilization system protein ParE
MSSSLQSALPSQPSKRSHMPTPWSIVVLAEPLLERFPYGLYYRAEGDDVVVVAYMHAARNPRRWRSRLAG